MFHNVKLQMNMKTNKRCYRDMFVIVNSTEENYKSENLK